MPEQLLRLFVSSPGDVAGERHRIDLVVERLNAEFAGRVRIETVRWERSYYSAHDTFQRQIPEAGECDVVVAVFRGRLGTPLPPEFPPLPSGEPYPSGTAYEILSAIEVRKAGKRVPDVYVFRYPSAPSVALDAPDRAEVEAQWGRLKGFFDRWFQTQAGQFVAAFQTYASTDDFAAKVEDCLRQWLATRGYLAQGPVWDRVLRGSPFPGLVAFEADRGAVFFGRDAAIGQAVARLREPGRAPFLLVLGASGAGKSSLLRAGLMPHLARPGTIPEVDLWRQAVLVPSPDPFAALAEALFADTALGAELRAGTFRTHEMLARQMAGDPALALAPLRDALDRAASRRQAEAGFDAPRPARLLLGVDQAERLFTEASQAAAAALATLLAALVRAGLATVVMVLRSDAYPRFQAVETLVGLREVGATLDLLPPAAAELEEIVARPVAACAPPLAFEARDGRSLAGLLVADARGGDALPLLQVSLARLYAAEAARGDGVLRFAAYSGMDAAVTQTANEALSTLDPAARAELPALVAGLVADVSTDPLTGTPVPLVTALDRPAFEAGQPARAALVEAFVAKRLLTAEGDAERQRVRPVHEALLRIWPLAVDIVADNAALIRVRRTLEPLVRAWSEAEEAARPGHLDLSPAVLDGAQGLVARFGPDLPEPMRAFIAQAAAADAARRDRERADQERRIRDAEALATARRRTARRTLAGLAAALVLAVLAGWQWREAGQQRDRARRSLTLATQTANGLVVDLAAKFRDSVGVPAATVKAILDRARALQDQLLASGESTPELRRSQAGALLQAAQTFLTLGSTTDALQVARQGKAITEGLVSDDPGSVRFQGQLAFANDVIGEALQAQSDLVAAVASFQAALAIRTTLAAAAPDDLERRYDVALQTRRLGNAQFVKGDHRAAQASFQAAFDIAEGLAAAQAGNAKWQRELAADSSGMGFARVALTDPAGALRHFLRGRDILERLTAASPNDAALLRDLSVTDDQIGIARMALGDRFGAGLSYVVGLGIKLRLAATDPGNTRWQHDIAQSYRTIAHVYEAVGNPVIALAGYQDELAVERRLTAGDPANAIWQVAVAAAYDDIGRVLLARGDKAGALASDQAAFDVVERLAKASPGNGALQSQLAEHFATIGTVQRAMGELDKAVASLRAGIAIVEQLVEQDPANIMDQRKLALGYDAVAKLEAQAGATDDARADLRRGRAVISHLVEEVPSDANMRKYLKEFDTRIAAMGR